ncbi:MAG: porin family protein [Candidatus Aminicenantes bacterium]
MKKIIIVALFVLLLVNVSNSQVLLGLLFGDKLVSENFELGVRLAGNLSSLTNTADSKMEMGLALGLYGTIKINDKFALQPEVFLRCSMGAKGISPVLLGDPNLDPLITDAEVTTQLTYFSIPVLAKYSFKEEISFGIGPQFGILTGAKNKYVSEVFESDDLVFKDDVKSQFQSFDFGLVFNLEYRFLGKRGINVNLRYYLGLMDTIRNNPGIAAKNSIIQVAIGVAMGKKENAE